MVYLNLVLDDISHLGMYGKANLIHGEWKNGQKIVLKR